MKYFSVTVMEKGKKRQEIVKATNKVSAIKVAKQKFPRTMIIKAVETSAPLEDTLSELLSAFKKSLKSKISINDKISTIRQIAVMTDAGIAINDTLEDVADNTHNNRLKEIYNKINAKNKTKYSTTSCNKVIIADDAYVENINRTASPNNAPVAA